MRLVNMRKEFEECFAEAFVDFYSGVQYVQLSTKEIFSRIWDILNSKFDINEEMHLWFDECVKKTKKEYSL